MQNNSISKFNNNLPVELTCCQFEEGGQMGGEEKIGELGSVIAILPKL